MIRHRSKLRRRGASAVEFALVFPLVLFFFTGLVAFSQAILLRDTAQHAAYEGARKGITLDANKEDVIHASKEFLKVMNVQNPEINVTPENVSSTTRDVTVSVRIPFRDNAWIAAGFIPENWALGAQVRLTKFREVDAE